MCAMLARYDRFTRSLLVASDRKKMGSARGSDLGDLDLDLAAQAGRAIERVDRRLHDEPLAAGREPIGDVPGPHRLDYGSQLRLERAEPIRIGGLFLADPLGLPLGLGVQLERVQVRLAASAIGVKAVVLDRSVVSPCALDVEP